MQRRNRNRPSCNSLDPIYAKEFETHLEAYQSTMKGESQFVLYTGVKEKCGDVSVELDALPVGVLRQRLIDEVEKRIDLDALATVKLKEKADLRRLDKLLSDG